MLLVAEKYCSWRLFSFLSGFQFSVKDELRRNCFVIAAVTAFRPVYYTVELYIVILGLI